MPRVQPDLLLPILFFIAATLYSSVGHAGASGYLAAMALIGTAPGVMKPTALILNILVATIALVQFARAGHFNGRLLWPFALGSIPLAAIGGSIQMSGALYRPLVGLVLLAGAMKLLWDNLPRQTSSATTVVIAPPALPIAIVAGAAIGLLAGMTGTGGGIFLSPLLLFMRWGETRQTGGVAAAFILLNSIAGLLGHWPMIDALPRDLPWWALTVVAGGVLGSTFGSRFASSAIFKGLLSIVLIIAAGKLLFS